MSKSYAGSFFPSAVEETKHTLNFVLKGYFFKEIITWIEFFSRYRATFQAIACFSEKKAWEKGLFFSTLQEKQGEGSHSSFY